MTCVIEHRAESFRDMRLTEILPQEVVYTCPLCGLTVRKPRCPATSMKSRLRCRAVGRPKWCATHKAYAMSSVARARWQKDRDADARVGFEVVGLPVWSGYADATRRSRKGRR